MDGAYDPRARRWDLLRLLGRHQLASIFTTVVDFSVMILLVQLSLAPAAVAAVAGACVGAFVNFELGRRWTFSATSGARGGQALRYALVSATSAALNGGGELVMNGLAGVNYLAARAVVAVLVSLAWNLPMQRHFVFAAPRREPEATP